MSDNQPPIPPSRNPSSPPSLNPAALKELWHYNLTNHKPTAAGIQRIEALRSATKAMADALIDLVPAGRDQAIALGCAEEMLFHANAGVARTMNEDRETTSKPAEDQQTSSADSSAESDKQNG